MWSRNNLSRSSSLLSSRSPSSSRLSKYEQSIHDQQDEQTEKMLWSRPTESKYPTETPTQHSRAVSTYNDLSSTSIDDLESKMRQKFLPGEYEPWPQQNTRTIEQEQFHHEDQSVTSQDSHSTLANELDKVELIEHTPKINAEITASSTALATEEKKYPTAAITSIPTSTSSSSVTSELSESTPADFPVAGGSLATQLATLLSQVQSVERSQPTIMAADYQQLQDRVNTLETEKRTWQARQEGLFGLRDEDVGNLIKIRGFLAVERRERATEQIKHAALERFMEEQVKSLVAVRDKLAHLTWATEKNAAFGKRGSTTPANPIRQSMREGGDLWKAAKHAALEHRVLELEQANSELKAKLDNTNIKSEAVVGGSAKSLSINSATTFESARVRERMNIKLLHLRSENESLRKEVSRLEDRNFELEEIIQGCQRVM